MTWRQISLELPLISFFSSEKEEEAELSVNLMKLNSLLSPTPQATKLPQQFVHRYIFQPSRIFVGVSRWYRVLKVFSKWNLSLFPALTKALEGTLTLGLMTFSIMTLSLMTLSIMTLSLMTLSIMTFSIKGLCLIVCMNDSKHN
jgi:hypothetical protein